MTTDEIRQKYIAFFVDKGHIEISPAPLVLEGDSTTLFTSAGMQPLVPYLKGEVHPQGKRLVNSQPSLRLQDIEEVGDNRHTTFFEMLGNWSLGDYFKKEQLVWIWQFFTKELGIDEKKLYVSVFEGEGSVPKDEEAIEIWKGLGIPEDHIFEYGSKKNWWSRSGVPENMPAGEIGGPDSEIFYDFGGKTHEGCHPNCDCGRFLEIGNSVFMQYQKKEDGTLKELPQKNVDFGGGLERIAAVLNGDPDIFKINVFTPVIKILEEESGKKYEENEETSKSFRIIADHLRASVAIASEGIEPANKLQGYALRRLIRRAVVKMQKLNLHSPKEVVAQKIAGTYSGNKNVTEVIKKEVERFNQTINLGLKEVEKVEKIDGKIAFDLYQSYGFPLEITEELFREKGQKINLEEFRSEFEKHKELSRSASAGMFKGGLADNSEIVTRYHTATHLLHAALRKVLGESVSQKGSNITAERLRFDFSFPQKLTDEQVKKVEDLINEQIKKSLPVTLKTESLDEAIAEGALHFFAEKYGKEVKVYTIGNENDWFSKEVCMGPHVANTSEIGHVRISKQEKVGSGIMRIYITSKPE